jgi:hypothetical protein
MKHLKLFEDFLNEFRSVGQIYHFTTLESLEDILESDSLVGIMFDYGKAFVSFTRNPALNFSKRKVRITFDGDAMSNRIHFEPFLYDITKDPLFADGNFKEPMSYNDRRKMYGEEREERARSPINGIRKYIVRVDVLDSPRAELVVNHLRKKYPEIEFNVAEKFLLPVERKLQAA